MDLGSAEHEREIMLFIGKPMGRSIMISYTEEHVVYMILILTADQTAVRYSSLIFEENRQLSKRSGFDLHEFCVFL